MKVYRCVHVEKQVENVSSDGPLGGYEEQIDQPCGIEAASLEDLLFKLGDRFGLNINEIIRHKNPGNYIEYHRLENDKFLQPTGREMDEYNAGCLDLWQAYYQFTIRVIDQRYLDDSDFDQLTTADPDISVID
jgi:hypothetical protein